MFCSKCGKEISDDAAFCSFCGNKFSQNTVATNKNSVYCPKCNSKNLESTVENDVHGGGYSLFKGCLFGWIFGILGLFFGKQKVKTTTKTYFLCMDCSTKFREANKFAQEKSKQSVSKIIWSIVLILLGIFYITESEVIFGIIVLAIGVYLGYSGYKLKKEHEDINLNKYNADCYKN